MHFLPRATATAPSAPTPFFPSLSCSWPRCCYRRQSLPHSWRWRDDEDGNNDSSAGCFCLWRTRVRCSPSALAATLETCRFRGQGLGCCSGEPFSAQHLVMPPYQYHAEHHKHGKDEKDFKGNDYLFSLYGGTTGAASAEVVELLPPNFIPKVC